jgi:hypothetical protein
MLWDSLLVKAVKRKSQSSTRFEREGVTSRIPARFTRDALLLIFPLPVGNMHGPDVMGTRMFQCVGEISSKTSI